MRITAGLLVAMVLGCSSSESGDLLGDAAAGDVQQAPGENDAGTGGSPDVAPTADTSPGSPDAAKPADMSPETGATTVPRCSTPNGETINLEKCGYLRPSDYEWAFMFKGGLTCLRCNYTDASGPHQLTGCGRLFSYTYGAATPTPETRTVEAVCVSACSECQ